MRELGVKKVWKDAIRQRDSASGGTRIWLQFRNKWRFCLEFFGDASKESKIQKPSKIRGRWSPYYVLPYWKMKNSKGHIVKNLVG